MLNKDASSIRAFYNGIKVALKDLPISQIDLSNFDKYFKGDDEWDVDKIISNLYLGQLGKLQKISIQNRATMAKTVLNLIAFIQKQAPV